MVYVQDDQARGGCRPPNCYVSSLLTGRGEGDQKPLTGSFNRYSSLYARIMFSFA